MIRAAAIFCFSLTLFCPIFCLSGAGDECSERDRPEDGRNCEAMSIGAVVVKSVIDTTPLCRSVPSIDQFLPAESLALGYRRRLPLGAWNRAHSKPPPASTRQALLQTFLF